jgi:propane monooxygenase coupling protein
MTGHGCSVTLSMSREGNAIAELLEGRSGVTVTRLPALVRLDAPNRIEFDLGEIAEWLGEPSYSAYDLQVELSSASGHLVALDDRVVLYARAEDAPDELALADPARGPRPSAGT